MLIGNSSEKNEAQEVRDITRNLYLPFPRELRDMIMEEALIEGEVYLSKPSLEFDVRYGRDGDSDVVYFTLKKGVPKFKQCTNYAKSRLLQLSSQLKRYRMSLLSQEIKVKERKPALGVQLLATNSFVMQEAAPIFYGRNTFYIPPGPVFYTTNVFDNIRSEHQRYMRSLATKFSIRDLTPEIVKVTKPFVIESSNPHDYPYPKVTPDRLATCCVEQLKEIWFRKFFFIYTWYAARRLDQMELDYAEVGSLKLCRKGGPDRVIVRFGPPGDCYTADTEHCTATEFRFRKALNEDLHSFAFVKIHYIILAIGWKGFKKWLKEERDYPGEPWNNRDDWRI